MGRQKRSNSQGCIPTYAYRSRERRHSEGSLQLAPGLQGLRKTVTGILMSRLASNGLVMENTMPQLLDHCLPNSTRDGPWGSLLRTPLQVSDHALLNCVSLEPIGETSQPRQTKQQADLYIRSFQLTVGQLHHVIVQLNDAGVEHAKTIEWSRCIGIMKPGQIVFVRYVGITTRGALLRHREDLLTRKRGLLARFLDVLANTYPTVIDSAGIYVFKFPQFFNHQQTDRFNEIREQAAIALLGFPSLLNQRPADTLSWSLSSDVLHRRGFEELRTNTILRLSPLKFEPIRDPGLIRAWADQIQRYANLHKLSVSTYRGKIYDFPDSLRNTVMEQALPSALDGKSVLMLTIGAGISQKDYHNSQAFYSASSDSAILIRSSLTRLWRWEQPGYPPDYNIYDLISRGVLPFVDMCPWLRADDSDLLAATSLVKQYIMTTRPLIVLTFSAKPSSIAASGFCHTFGYPASCKFWSKVGHVNLVQCEDNWFIQIPCFHPGQARFSLNPSVFLKVLDMTLWVLLLTVSTGLDHIQALDSASRKDWCNYVIEKVELILQEKDFYSLFNSLKSQLHSERPKTRLFSPLLQGRSSLAVATRKNVNRFIFSGFAVGNPTTDRRRQQVYHLWGLNMPELHGHIGRENAHDWFLWANTLEEGTSFFVDAVVRTIWTTVFEIRPNAVQRLCSDELSAAKGALGARIVSEEFSQLLDIILRRPHESLSYEDTVGLITLELSTNLRLSQWAQACELSEGLFDNRKVLFQPEYNMFLNGTEIYVWKNCSFAIYWEDSYGYKFRFIMRAPQSSRDQTFLKRKYIFFIKEGIDLRDESGVSCLAHKGALCSSSPVTFPIYRLFHSQETSELGLNLLRLWEQETGLAWENIITTLPSDLHKSDNGGQNGSLPITSFAGKCRELIRLNWKGPKLIPYEVPPQPADETWLLWQCLRKNWPTGGTLFIGDPAKWPERTDNMWVHFHRLLAQPVYCDHPRAAFVWSWIRDLSNPRKTAQMIKNLRYIGEVKNARKIQKRDYERIRAEGKDVKIAGTELEIVPRWLQMAGEAAGHQTA